MIADRTDAMISVGGFTEMGAVTRHRAAGTRDRILSRLRAAGEITDPGGLASAALAKAVDYPGSSAAFAQLLSGIERDGLIEREVRGKRTYRIRLAEPGPEMASARGEQESEPRTSAAAAFDYDELAMRLLRRWCGGSPRRRMRSPCRTKQCPLPERCREPVRSLGGKTSPWPWPAWSGGWRVSSPGSASCQRRTQGSVRS